MSFYELNLEALKKHNALLYQGLTENVITREDGSLEIDINDEKNPLKDSIEEITSVEARDGTSIIKLKKDGKEYCMNSQYRPFDEAVKFADQYENVIDHSVMMMLGLSNGIVAHAICEKLGDNVQFIFFEPSPKIFLFAMQHYDLVDIIQNGRVFLFVKGLNEERLEPVMAGLVSTSNYRHCIMDALPKYHQLFPEEYDIFEEKYRFAVNSVRYNIVTRQWFSKEMTKNQIYNMHYFLKSNCGEDFDNVFPKDIPAILVAAGPSLEKNVQLLKEAKGKLFIVAVDTALRYLADEGIRPDLAVTVDPNKPLRLFERDELRDIPIAVTSASNYKVLDAMNNKKVIYVSTDNPYYEKMAQVADRHMRFLPNGGSVATVAFAMLMNWGFQKIVLIGQDLALAKDKVHAGKDDVDLGKLEGDKIAIEGYYGETVYTTRDYDEYRKWYELIARSSDKVEIINSTEGGAKIHGATQMSLREVIDQYASVSYDYEAMLTQLEPMLSEEEQQKVVVMWKESIENLIKLDRKLKEGIRLSEQGLRMLERHEYTKSKLKQLQNKINRILGQCDTYYEIFFVDSLCANEQEDVLGDIYDTMDTEEEEYKRLLQKLRDYMKDMDASVDEVKEMFQYIVEQA
ncbi:MAG: motility associated factor glycosyltransferase family protein [Lachnospiraceae bacterium]